MVYSVAGVNLERGVMVGWPEETIQGGSTEEVQVEANWRLMVLI